MRMGDGGHLNQEEGAKHAEREADEELGQHEQLPAAELVHDQHGDGGARHLDHTNHDGADVGIELDSINHIHYTGDSQPLTLLPAFWKICTM